MAGLVEAHLDGVATQLGSLLRGFCDPSVHIGSPDRFAREFRRVLDLPALRRPDGDEPLSYSAAVLSYRSPRIEPQANDPASILIRGLGGPATLATGIRAEVPLETLRQDVAALLRVPVLRFYLQVQERNRFLSEADQVAVQGGFSVVHGHRDDELRCLRCGRSVDAADHEDPAACRTCGHRYETFILLPMVSAVKAVLSYDFLRRTLDSELVSTYQEEGEIRPIEAGGGAS